MKVVNCCIQLLTTDYQVVKQNKHHTFVTVLILTVVKMENVLSFDQLPNVVTMLVKEISELKSLLLKKSEQGLNEQSEKFLSIQEASQFLNLSVPTIYSKVSRNELPFMKRSKKLYFSSIDLMDYLKQGRKKSKEEIANEVAQYLARNK